MVVKFIDLPQEQEFLKNTSPRAHSGDSRSHPKIPKNGFFSQYLTNNRKTVWSAQSGAFSFLKTYPNFIRIRLELRAQRPFSVLGPYLPLLGPNSRLGPNPSNGVGQDWTGWVQILVLACPHPLGPKKIFGAEIQFHRWLNEWDRVT